MISLPGRFFVLLLSDHSDWLGWLKISFTVSLVVIGLLTFALVFSNDCYFRSRLVLSFLGLLNLCRSKVGSTCLRSWLLRPLKNLVTIQERHDAVEYFSKSSNQELVTLLQAYLVDVGSIKVRFEIHNDCMLSICLIDSSFSEYIIKLEAIHDFCWRMENVM